MLVSAVIADGPPRRVLEVICDGDFELVVPQLALAELRRVLTDKLGLPTDEAGTILALIEEIADAIAPTPTAVTPRSGDPSDDQLIAAALASEAKVLISGDQKHVLPLHAIGTMRIIRPQDFIAEHLNQ